MLSLLLVLALGISCDESLPPYVAPAILFNSTISPAFVKNKLYGPQLLVTLTIKNTFDETLQDTASLVGNLEIMLARDPSISKTATFDRTNILRKYPYVDGPTIDEHGILTIASGDSLKFLYAWNLVSDNGVYLPRDFFVLHADPQYPGHFIASPETFVVRASLKVFTKIGVVIFQPVDFVFIYDTP